MFQNGFDFTKVYQRKVRGIPGWRGKVPAIVSQSVALRKIRCLPNEPWVHTQSKKYIGSALKNNHEKAQGSCALSPWSLAGAAIFNYISFPVCNFWLDWFDVTRYVYSQGSTGSRFFQLHQYFLWYCEWRRGKVIDSGSREIEGVSQEIGTECMYISLTWLTILRGIALQPSRILCWKRILIGEYSQTLVFRRNLPQWQFCALRKKRQWWNDERERLGYEFQLDSWQANYNLSQKLQDTWPFTRESLQLRAQFQPKILITFR